jgi:hypothetical protein
MGISGGGGRKEYHGQGRAIDFAGAAGPNFDLTVERNWDA